jgi:hypothetical protein
MLSGLLRRPPKKLLVSTTGLLALGKLALDIIDSDIAEIAPGDRFWWTIY